MRFPAGQNHGTAPARTIQPANHIHRIMRILDDGKLNPVLPLAAVEDRVEVAAPRGVDGDFRAPLVLEEIVFLRRQQRVGCGPVGGHFQLGLHDEFLGSRC